MAMEILTEFFEDTTILEFAHPDLTFPEYFVEFCRRTLQNTPSNTPLKARV
jgi:hypothetical protein